jgi:hypothetical protein
MSSEKNSELSEYSELTLEKKFGIVRILRMTSEKISESSEFTSEKNSELRSQTTTLIRKILSDLEIIPG